MHLLTAFLAAAATQIAPAPLVDAVEGSAAAPGADRMTAGTYALVMRFVTEADAPIVGKVTTATITTALVDVQSTDGHIIARQKACSMATDGGLFDYRGFIEEVHAGGALAIVAADPLALCLCASPGELGADVAVGSAQRFGVPMGFGGPHAAYIATRSEYVRSMPGRLTSAARYACRWCAPQCVRPMAAGKSRP